MNRENLLKLAEALEGPLPKNFEFNMGQFEADGNRVEHNCGTAGCALGYATIAVTPLLVNENGYRDEVWEDYATRVFGINQDTGDGARQYTWLFSGGWSGTDDTPEGAAARIRYILDGNEVPLNMFKQMGGNAPLSYAR